MAKKIFLLLAILLKFSESEAQKTVFFDKYWEQTDEKGAKYVRNIREKGNIYEIEDYYYPSRKLQMTGIYLDSACRIKDGDFFYYFESGQLSSKANYIRGTIDGRFEAFHSNGKKMTEGFYENGNPINTWKTYDSTGVKSTISEYDKNGNLVTKTWYYPDGKLKREETYKKGKFKKGYCFNSAGFDTTYFPESVMPEFPGGMDKLYAYLSKNIEYPSICKDNNIEGKVILEFDVTKEGKIENIEVGRNPHPKLTEEAIRVVKSMPDWKPGMEEGVATKIKFTLPVRFKLN